MHVNQFILNDMLNQNETCSTCSDSNTNGYFFAFLTALACPCHLPLVGIFLGTGAAGAFFAQYFMLLAILMGILCLISFVAAARVLL